MQCNAIMRDAADLARLVSASGEDHCDRRTTAVSKPTSDVDHARSWRPDRQSTDDGRPCHRHLSVSVLSAAPTMLCCAVADVGGSHDARPLFCQHAS